MISIIGIGPSPEDMSIRALNTIKDSEVIIGYKAYIKQIEHLIDGKEVIKKGMGDEIERAEIAIQKSREGKKVAIISSGDPGVFGMGNVIFQLIDKYSDIEVNVIPGVTAATFAASKLGAPLHDFAVISLSDILTPLSEIKRKVEFAAKGDFVIAIYNPLSKTRKKPFEEAYKILLRNKKRSTPVGIVKSRESGVDVTVTTLGNMRDHEINMSTTIIIGNSMTYIQNGHMVTPRGYVVKSDIHQLSREFYECFLDGEVVEGPNLGCEFYPCHTKGENCTFCYCPFYPCGDSTTGGKWIKDKGVWSCQDCSWIHQDNVVKCILPQFSKIVKEVDDLKKRKKELLKLRRECIQRTE
ncbi:MAG: precorrin-3B C(17)-methyltransferase [Methanobacterium sp.]|uniref:precorrin-3B C(17)-methyltransferase n=1 Tax=Methanobacterium sp. TaxID=2164 RepID=UPI003D649D2D|nr:precorrin-3B C(17)-methyltransferase [Methanobacterium sp.]